MTATKVHFHGTHRVRHPDQTWDLIAPLLPRFGITRVADVTGLDVLGVPVAMAVRPLAATLSVSQGKGATYTHAAVSAAMEAIEVWHPRRCDPMMPHTSRPAPNLACPMTSGRSTSIAAACLPSERDFGGCRGWAC